MALFCKKGQCTKIYLWLLTHFFNIFAPYIKNLETYFAKLICFEFRPLCRSEKSTSEKNTHTSLNAVELEASLTFYEVRKNPGNNKKNVLTKDLWNINDCNVDKLYLEKKKFLIYVLLKQITFCKMASTITNKLKNGYHFSLPVFHN